ncbi:glycosyltransferase [Sphingobacterium multivorum]|uniref:glycosyltransferase n=1 Tax=Sphingobacterium multivorum TaxID=28454 RepID=UPI0028B0FE47|nr:glycosyltransferase [Sphingobacterium multivorum]
MSFNIIITSYNRPKKVEWLVGALNSTLVKKIIIVDSGNNDFNLVALNRKVEVYRSSHKNQPYQRFLGFCNTDSKWVLFLDDDMEPMEGWDRDIVEIINKYNEDIGLIGLNFKDLHQHSFLNKNHRSITSSNSSSKFFNFIRKITGYPILSHGIYYKNGVKGAFPTVESFVEHVSGGAFLANKDFLYKNVNFELFSLYEKRLGKGEDGILGYSVSKMAPVVFYPKQLFWHNDQGNSIYTQNHYQFNFVVAFSRLYLNREYYRLNKKSLILAWSSYLNYSIWRIVGLTGNFLIKPSKVRFSALRGYFMGSIKALYFRYNKDLKSVNQYWLTEVNNDSLKSSRGGEVYG